MNAVLLEALDRTFRLMRDDLIDAVNDNELAQALTGTNVVLAGTAENLSTHAAQSAYITAALLMARSGHKVYLAAPDVRLCGAQPPLKGNHLVSALMDISDDLLPGVGFSTSSPPNTVTLCVCFGDSPQPCGATRIICVNASAWKAELSEGVSKKPWMEAHWPCGALAAANMATVEAFKAAMHQLRAFASNPLLFDQLFAYCNNATLELAPAPTPPTSDLGAFDFISGGAITHCTLFALARLPRVTGRVRVIEPESSDLTNLNRYMLLLRSATRQAKGLALRSLMPLGFELQAIQARYDGGRMATLGDFAPAVLVGADDIPTRWKIQAQNPPWLGIGATSHWASMVSCHTHDLPCARCLHPRDEVTIGPLPTAPFVSFFAGLMLACYYLRMRAGKSIGHAEQYVYGTPFRPEAIWRSPVSARAECQNCRLITVRSKCIA